MADANFESLYADHRLAILRYLLKMSRDPELADDLAQDVYLRLREKFASFDAGRGRFESWALSIAHNICVDMWRKAARVSYLDGQTAPADGQNPADLLEIETMSALVREAIFALPEPERRVFYFMKVKHWSREQIGLRLKMSPRTVSRRIVRAIELLRAELELRGVSL